MDEIRSWWEVPCIAHFCYIFRKPFKLPEFEIEELEDTLLLDCAPTPSALLVELFCTFLNGIVDKDITEDNWPFFLKLHIEWRCEYLKEKWNPFSDNKEYKDLTIRQRVETLHKLCHWRLELDDIADLFRGLDGPSLRLEPLGKDSEGSLYWYFFGIRLYKEESKKKKKENGPTPAKKGRGKGGATPKNTPTAKKKSTPANNRTPASRRSNARGRGSKKQESNEVDADEENNEVKEDEKTERESVESNINGVASATGWHVACNTLEEWEELVENLGGTKHQETRKLIRILQDEYLPDIERIEQQRERQFKKKMLAELPRRTSDRIAIKAAQRIEEERHDAFAREEQRLEFRRLQAEEEKAKQEEADEKRRRRHDEAAQRRKQRQEEQARVRKEEEENWEKALSGELSGPRKAAQGAAEGMSDTQRLTEELQMQLVADRDEDLYTAMFKILNCLRAEEDAWVFEEPVTESIAPGYFDVVDKPMDYSTVEKKIENNSYKMKDEFVSDIEQVFANCCAYNGDDSEYSELAGATKKAFELFCKRHFEGEEPIEEDGAGGKGKKSRNKRDSRSPSACKTPELTSESSSEEEESDHSSDESYEEGKKPSKKYKGQTLKLSKGLQNKLSNLSEHGMGGVMGGVRPPGHMHPGMMPPHFHPNYFQMMQQRFGMKAPPPGSGDPMAYRYPPPHPHMAPSRLPPPYPGQPHPEMVARQHAMYQRPPPDGRHMYPPHGHYPPHAQHPHAPHPSMPQHGPPPPHGYPPYPMYPRHPHMPPYPPVHGVPRPPSQQPSRPTSASSPGVQSPPLRQMESPSGRKTASPAGSSARQTASPAGSSKRMTESPAGEMSGEKKAPSATTTAEVREKGEGSSQPEEGHDKEQSSQEKGEEEREDKDREKVKGAEEKPGSDGGKPSKEGSEGKQQMQQPISSQTAEMMRQQQEYQRYRYHQQLIAMHHQRQQREGGGAYGSYLPPEYNMPPQYSPGPMGQGATPNHSGSGPGGEREAAAMAYYWQQQQQMYGGGHDPRQMAEQQRYWHEMEMRKRQHMAAVMKHQMAQQQARHGSAHPRPDGSAHPRPDGSSHPRPDGSAHPRPDGSSHPRPDGSAHPRPDTSAHPRHDSSAHPRPDGSSHPPKDSMSHSQPESSAHSRPESSTHPRPEGSAHPSEANHKSEAKAESDVKNGEGGGAMSEDKPSLPATDLEHKTTQGDDAGDLSDDEGLSNSEQKKESVKTAESADKLSPEKQSRVSHSHSSSRGVVPHSHSVAPGYGGPMPHGNPATMPNGYMDPSMGGYPPPHPGMYHHHAHYPHHPHMDPANAGMEYRNGLGGPSQHYPPGFYPPPHQRMPYYPSPPHSGGMSPYHQMPPHQHFNPQAQGHHQQSSDARRMMSPSQSGIVAPQGHGPPSSEAKVAHPPPTPPLEDEPPAKRSKVES